MMARLLQVLFSAEALGLLLSGLALQVLVYGVSSSLRDTDTSAFLWVCLLAALVGYGMGKARWKGWQAAAGSAALGLALVWVLGAHLAVPLVNLLGAGLSILPKLVPAVRSGVPLDPTRLAEAWEVIAQASASLATRFQSWIPGFDGNITTNDTLIRSMVWTLTLWLCAAWLGWFAEKRKAVASLFPAMAVLAAVISYSEYGVESLWMLVVILLFQMGIWNYREHTLRWTRQRIDFSESITFDSTQAVLFLTLAAGTFAFITPSVSWRDVLDYVRDRGRDNDAAEMLGIQAPAGGSGMSGGEAPTLPRDHLLGGDVATSEEVVMTIRTGELPPLPNELLPAEPPRYYWRSTVYDRYVGSGWVSSAVTPQTVSANTPLIPGLLRGYRLVPLDVRMNRPKNRLFWSGILFSADRSLQVDWRVRPPSDLFAEQSDLLQADIFAVTSQAETYQVETYVPIPTVNELRSASAEYPEGIRERYLALPSSVPNRVRDLARQITDGLINPYERAKAIETYLRTNYPYDPEVPLPPDDRDVTDFFLFDLKRGYCDYYATAMVVLARASGLPARFVSGYAPGEYDALDAQYIVRELNAHSWAEVYFPEIGWVEFEPTASLPVIERLERLAPPPDSGASEQAASELLARFRLEQIMLWSSPALVFLLAAVLHFALIERWLVVRLAPPAAIETIYQRFYRAGRPLAGAWVQAETSSEFLMKMQAAVAWLEAYGRFSKMLARARENAVSLTGLYHESLFGDHRTERSDALLAWKLWERLRVQLLAARILRRVFSLMYSSSQS